MRIICPKTRPLSVDACDVCKTARLKSLSSKSREKRRRRRKIWLGNCAAFQFGFAEFDKRIHEAKTSHIAKELTESTRIIIYTYGLDWIWMFRWGMGEAATMLLRNVNEYAFGCENAAHKFSTEKIKEQHTHS